jgi:hypothetical protein
MTPALLLVTLFAPGHHAGVAVSPDLVCNVQRAIRHRAPAWEASTCRDVARAIEQTARPRTTLAMAVLESDLRVGVAVEAKPGVFDVGLLGVRCVVRPGFTARDTGSRSAEILTSTQTQTDGMLAGRCQNGPARGHTLVTLADPVTNIHVAAQIMADKRARFGKDWAWRYNGASKPNGYSRKVRVVEAALGGVRLRTKCGRVRRLVELILAAVAPRIAMER